MDCARVWPVMTARGAVVGLLNIREPLSHIGLILAVKMASTEVEYQPAEEKKTGIVAQLQGFKDFMWNGEKGEFMGRDGRSWGEYALCTFHAINTGMVASIPNGCPNNGESYDLDEKLCF